MWGSILIALIVFILGTPLYLIDPALFFNGFFDRFVFGGHLRTFAGFIKPLSSVFDPLIIILNGISNNLNQLGYEDGIGLLKPTLVNLMLWLTVAGLIYGLVRRTIADWLLVVGIVFYIILVFQDLRVPLWHYLLPAVPMLLILAGRLLYDLATWLGKQLVNWTSQNKAYLLASSLSGLLILALAYQMLSSSLAWSDMMNAPSWQVQLGWINQNIPVGSKIAYENPSPRVSKILFEAENVQAFNYHSYNWYLENGFNYVLITPEYVGRSASGQLNDQPHQPYLDLKQKATLLNEIAGQWLEAPLQIWQLPTTLAPGTTGTKVAKEAYTLQSGKLRPTSGISNGDFETDATFSQDWYVEGGKATIEAGQVNQGKFVLQLEAATKLNQLIPASAFAKQPQLSFNYRMLNQLNPSGGALQLRIQFFTAEGELMTERNIAINGGGRLA